MIQLDIFDRIQQKLKSDKSVTGIMLMGSVAHGDALSGSDLDIMVLCDENCFKTEVIEGILVEYIFTSYDCRLQKLMNSDIEVYHFLDSKIPYDAAGKLKDLQNAANEIYSKYKTSPETKKQISHWLLSTKTKLESAINSNDLLKQRYIVSTNSWKIIEAIWAVNNKPTPPQSSVIRHMNDLDLVPFPNWFAKLFDETPKADTMLEIIRWVLHNLEENNQ
jgi:Nucleotidyltransferase domain.